MSESTADQPEGVARAESEWWRSRPVLWSLGAVVGLFVAGALSSGLFPSSTWASLVTGLTWSLVWLILLVLLAVFGGQWMRTRLG